MREREKDKPVRYFVSAELDGFVTSARGLSLHRPRGRGFIESNAGRCRQ